MLRGPHDARNASSHVNSIIISRSASILNCSFIDIMKLMISQRQRTAENPLRVDDGYRRNCMNSPLVVPGLAALKDHLNAEIGVSDYVTVDQARINGFADLTEDWQWIHVDVERAKNQTPLGTTVAHGFLGLSLLSRFVNAVVEVRGAKSIVSAGLSSVRFITPLAAGSRVRGRVRMRECAESPGFVQVTWRVTAECEGVRHPCFTAEWAVRYYA